MTFSETFPLNSGPDKGALTTSISVECLRGSHQCSKEIKDITFERKILNAIICKKIYIGNPEKSTS